MNEYICEAYEDNAGGLHIFVLDGETVVWGSHYYGRKYEAAKDWLGLMVQGLDPVAEGWETNEDIDFGEDYKDCRPSKGVKHVASNEWGHLLLGIDIGELASAGQDFAIECGVLYRCPECGEVGECELEPYYENPCKPERCECCDAKLDD